MGNLTKCMFFVDVKNDLVELFWAFMKITKYIYLTM